MHPQKIKKLEAPEFLYCIHRLKLSSLILSFLSCNLGNNPFSGPACQNVVKADSGMNTDFKKPLGQDFVDSQKVLPLPAILLE